MAFWWVNHKQTFKQEVGQGYIWSPKRNNDGSFNQSYDNMTLVRRHDIIFSYAFQRIAAIGVIESEAKDSSQPEEFGSVGQQWAKDGWLVNIVWEKLDQPLIPKDHLSQIAPLLPSKYSPLQPNGNGNQGRYLSLISDYLGALLLGLIEQTNPLINLDLNKLNDVVSESEIVYQIKRTAIAETIKDQLIKARVGQGRFRMEVEEIERQCRMTGLDDRKFLIASHIKPWKDSTDFERLDGNNGLLLSPHVDKLFDNGHITFSNEGDIIIPNLRVKEIMHVWKLNTEMNVGSFTDRQKEYLGYHRSRVIK